MTKFSSVNLFERKIDKTGKKSKAFTLVEVLLMIAAIGITVGLLFPA